MIPPPLCAFQNFASPPIFLLDVMPPRAASKAARAPPKPHNTRKSAAAVPAVSAASAASTDHADHVPLDPPVTPPQRQQARGRQLHFETSGERFPSVSLGSSSSDGGVPNTEDVFAPPVLISPIKRRQRQAASTINRLTDLEVWDMSDGEIIGRYN
jgi:hypothetical protein